MHYKITDENNRVIAIGTNCGGVEITEYEYNELLTMIRTKAELVNSLYNGEITIEEVPVEWQEEIQRRVDARISEQGTIEEQDISTDEFMEMLDEVM